MKNFYGASAFVLSVCIYATSFCVIDSLHLDGKNGQLILRIGEHHNQIYDPSTASGRLETRDSQQIFGLIDELNKINRPTTVILEMGPFLLDIFRHMQLPQFHKFGGLPTLALEASKAAHQRPKINFVYADRRNWTTEALECFFGLFCKEEFLDIFVNPFLAMLPDQESSLLENAILSKGIAGVVRVEHMLPVLDQYIKNNPQYAKCMFGTQDSVISALISKMKSNRPFVINEIFAAIEALRASHVQSLQQFSQENPCKLFIEERNAKIDNALLVLKSFLQTISSYDADRTAIDVIFDGLREKSFVEIAGQWRNAETLCLTYDIDLVIEISRALAAGHNVIVFGGSTHSYGLDKLIKDLGFESVVPAARDLCPHSALSMMSSQELKEKFSTIIDVFRGSNASTTSSNQPSCSCSSPQTVKTNAHSCNACGKSASKQCSRCKKVHYCSLECQKNDWPAHKQYCK